MRLVPAVGRLLPSFHLRRLSMAQGGAPIRNLRVLCWQLSLRLLAVLLLLAGPVGTYACDTYDSTTNQLTIPIGATGTTVFTNVVITVGQVVVLGGGPARGSYDTYIPETNQLVIPCVQVGNQTFTNVTITLGNLISVGAVDNAPVSPVLRLINPLPPATVGQAYSTNVVAGIFPDSTYTYAIDTLANGVLPTGMTINMNGTLSGTPFATGRTDVSGKQLPNTYTFGVCAIDTFSRVTTNPCPQTSIIVNPASSAYDGRYRIGFSGSSVCTSAGYSYPGSSYDDVGFLIWIDQGVVSGATGSAAGTGGTVSSIGILDFTFPGYGKRFTGSIDSSGRSSGTWTEIAPEPNCVWTTSTWIGVPR